MARTIGQRKTPAGAGAGVLLGKGVFAECLALIKRDVVHRTKTALVKNGLQRFLPGKNKRETRRCETKITETGHEESETAGNETRVIVGINKNKIVNLDNLNIRIEKFSSHNKKPN